MSLVLRAFAGAAIGGALGFGLLGPLGLILGAALGGAYGIGAAPR
ncbi:MAG: hypothetical protein ACLQJL_17485 [Roseiarcus sp.]